MFFLTLLLALLIAFMLCVWQKKKRPPGSPPGPVGLPLFGSMFSMGKNSSEYFRNLSKTYGNIVGVYIGPTFTVVLNDFETSRKAFLKRGEVFSGRNKSFAFDVATFRVKEQEKRHGITFSQGKHWKEQRKFAVSKLRELGMGKASMEVKIKEEVSALLNEFKKKEGCYFDTKPYFTKAVSNVICSILFGSRYDYDDEEFNTLMDWLGEAVENQEITGFIDVFPFLRILPGIRSRFNEFLNGQQNIGKFFKRKVSEHIESHNQNDTKDFIDVYIKEIKQMEKNNIQDSAFTAYEATCVSQDLFFGGSDTTSLTLYWGFLYLLHYPEVLENVQEEIDDVIGRSRLPSMRDIRSMPYTEATLAEIQRMANIAPLGIPHAVSQETVLRGYTIPARAPVILNMTAVMRDPRMFPNPDEFLPTRHLNSEGKFVKNEALIPFSVGRRACIGESLARMELFLFFTTLLQNFNINLPPGPEKPTLKPQIGLITASARPYKIKMTYR